MTDNDSIKNISEQLTFKSEHIAGKVEGSAEKAQEFCKGYLEFLDAGKTERECVKYVEKLAADAGFVPFEDGLELKAGSRVYFINNKKNIALVTVGSRPLTDGVSINVAHIDSPRLDLKPNPLYEKDEIAFFKTHYYGGIRKYQWATIPLSIHGTVFLNDGSEVTLAYGEKEGEPKFVISDLLPHLAAKQSERPLREGLKAEELNIILGNLPLTGGTDPESGEKESVSEPVKLMALKIMNELFGITEKDFFRAEIEIVPAGKACDIGFDRSMVGAYGQDDRVCAYTAAIAALETTDPEFTSITLLTDKEEIGSMGNTGMAGSFLDDIAADLCDSLGAVKRKVYRNSYCVSADVNSAYDPTFADVFEKNNSSFLSHGPVLKKYTGARGKSGASDASAETMAKLIGILDENEVIWQAGEIGKVDEGGGGTVALHVANMGINTVDMGVPVLAMHAPFEITSKVDVYYTYLAFKAFSGRKA